MFVDGAYRIVWEIEAVRLDGVFQVQPWTERKIELGGVRGDDRSAGVRAQLADQRDGLVRLMSRRGFTPSSGSISWQHDDEL